MSDKTRDSEPKVPRGTSEMLSSSVLLLGASYPSLLLMCCRTPKCVGTPPTRCGQEVTVLRHRQGGKGIDSKTRDIPQRVLHSEMFHEINLLPRRQFQSKCGEQDSDCDVLQKQTPASGNPNVVVPTP